MIPVDLNEVCPQLASGVPGGNNRLMKEWINMIAESKKSRICTVNPKWLFLTKVPSGNNSLIARLENGITKTKSRDK